MGVHERVSDDIVFRIATAGARVGDENHIVDLAAEVREHRGKTCKTCTSWLSPERTGRPRGQCLECTCSAWDADDYCSYWKAKEG